MPELGQGGELSGAAPSVGAYGLRLLGVGPELLLPAEPGWPALELVRAVGPGSHFLDRMTDERAEIVLANGGDIVVERRPARAVFTVPADVGDGELVHPYLAPVAAVVARWLGRESVHAGAFAVGNRAWGVLGEREAGKSSLLAFLALRGYQVVSDDVLILDGSSVFAGPRTIDLREEAAAELGVGTPLGIVGARERWRLTLDPVPSRLQLAGWIFLGWDAEPAVVRLAAGERLARIAAQRAVRLLPTDPGLLLRLSGLPGWELRRPRDWSSLPEATDLLLQAIA
jgi:hypothetical protein